MSESGWDAALTMLPRHITSAVSRNEPMNRHTTLRVGGPADLFYAARDVDSLAAIAQLAQRERLPLLLLGDGSNVCVSDLGVRGMVLRNLCSAVAMGVVNSGETAVGEFMADETAVVDTGHGFMRLSVRAMQESLSGLEWAVGIPGTVGGALVSNAGAYGGNICDIVRRIEVVEDGERKWVPPEWMEFSYRNSRLRRDGAYVAALLRVALALPGGDKRSIRIAAREIQWQRIMKQPWEPSAGSFFKNIRDRAVAARFGNLPERMRRLGVVPAAFLAEECGLKGFQFGGAAVAPAHANFIVNRGGATAADIRQVAEAVKSRVAQTFGIRLEEEVLYTGDWPAPTAQ